MKAKLLLLILFSMVLCSFAYAEYNYTDGLVSYYSFDNTTLDLYGLNNGISVGANCSTAVTGKINTSCAVYNSPTQYVKFNATPTFNSVATTDLMTFTSWVYPFTISASESDEDTFVYTSNMIIRFETSNDVEINIYTNVLGSIGGNIADNIWTTNEWQFIAVTYNGSHLIAYRNGIEAGYATGTGGIGTTGGCDLAQVIGRHCTTGTTEPFDGKFDEMAFYNRTLSANEILALYNNNTAGNSLYNMSGGINPPTPSDNPPTVTLLLPADATSTTNTTFNFSCSATDDNLVQNVTFYINSTGSFTANETNATTGNGTYSFNKNLSIGNYIWNCYACDNASQCSWGSANYSLTITAIPPVTSVKYLIKFINSTVNLMFGWVNHNGVIGTNTSIAFANRTADPEPISGYGQIFAKNENLFYLMPNGSLYRVNLTWVS